MEQAEDSYLYDEPVLTKHDRDVYKGYLKVKKRVEESIEQMQIFKTEHTYNKAIKAIRLELGNYLEQHSESLLKNHKFRFEDNEHNKAALFKIPSVDFLILAFGLVKKDLSFKTFSFSKHNYAPIFTDKVTTNQPIQVKIKFNRSHPNKCVYMAGEIKNGQL